VGDEPGRDAGAVSFDPGGAVVPAHHVRGDTRVGPQLARYRGRRRSGGLLRDDLLDRELHEILCATVTRHCRPLYALRRAVPAIGNANVTTTVFLSGVVTSPTISSPYRSTVVTTG